MTARVDKPDLLVIGWGLGAPEEVVRETQVERDGTLDLGDILRGQLERQPFDVLRQVLRRAPSLCLVRDAL